MEFLPLVSYQLKHITEGERKLLISGKKKSQPQFKDIKETIINDNKK